MLNNIAFIAVYFIEMLISYMFFSQIGEKKHNIWICFTIGIVTFEVGALFNFIFSNTVWLNLLVFVIINFVFSVCCFKIKFSKALFYSVILDLLSGASEFSSIFIISTLTQTKINAYNDSIELFIIDASISKILYFSTCMMLAHFIKKDKRNVKLPIELFFYPLVNEFVLIVLWGICANYNLSNKHRILLSVITIAIFFSTVIIFILYQNNIEKENQYFIMEKEMEKINTDKKYYDILEQQNKELMIYAHDTKKHLNAIRELNDNKQIDEYLTKMTDDLKAHSRACHCGNHTLDVIINKYVTECEIKGIHFDFDTRLSNLKVVDDYDLVTILGNILDNAVESADKSKEKYISLNTNKVNTYDSVIVNNSCDWQPETTDSELKTTKKDKKSHGLGIKSVKKILKKYKGDLYWEYDDKIKRFTTTIILK